jgi:2-C-methyl-D-erythritol 4-phosphate cytidylyltransferase/2-C-methyl-D-erythritol 4-phosphate cytidylyltransferase/2-C-methyl-D-erythritol 2,4-cyclodiphosphate synthase
MMNPSVAAIITAAGASSRMGGLKKEYRPLGFDARGNPLGGPLENPGGELLTVLGAAVRAFASVPRISLIVITVPQDRETGEEAARASLPPALLDALRPALIFVPGGPSRRASVHQALKALAAYEPAYVLIHDGARPWVGPDLIGRAIDGAIRHQAVVPLVPLTETPKEIDGSGLVQRHLRRAQIGAAQTPQGFAFPAILRAHEAAALREAQEGRDYTDDAEVWGEFQGPVTVIPGDPENRKITFPGDLPA